MQVIFESRQPWLEQLRGFALRRVRHATRPLGWLAPRARVRVSHVQEATGGIDKRCEVELTAEGAGTVVVTSITRDWGSALQSALSRAVRALLRQLQPARTRRPAIPRQR